MTYPSKDTLNGFMRLEDLSRRHNPIMFDATNNPKQVNFPVAQTNDQYTRDAFHKANLENLTRLGFNPEVITANDGSKSLRLMGEDAKRFASLSATLPEMANNLIQSSPKQKNSDGSVTIKTPAGEHYHSHLSALIVALRVVGITPPPTATYDHSNPIVSIQNNAQRDGIESILKPNPTHDHAILTLPKTSIDNALNSAEFMRPIPMKGSNPPSSIPPLHVQQIMLFNSEHRIPENTPLAPGYKDGGRGAKYDTDDGKTIIGSQRESITFKDPSEDPSLKRAIDKAKIEMSGMTSIAQKAEYLNKLVDNLLHQSDPDLNTKIINSIPPGPDGKRRPSLGDLIDNQTGVCRHRTILFKVLADNTGVPCAMVRGNFRDGNYGGGHAWNEVVQENGKRLLVDVMHGKVVDMSDPYARHYQDIKNRPMYDNNGSINHNPPPTPQSPKPAVSSSLDIAKLTIAQKMIAREQIEHTEKGNYLGVGKTQEDINTLKAALIAQGLEPDKHFKEKPSSLNGGKNIIQLTPEGSQLVDKIKADFQVGKPPVMVGKNQPAADTSEPLKHAISSPPPIDVTKLTNAQMTLAAAGITEAIKGDKPVTYIGVGKTSSDIENLRAALKIQGFEEGKHFTVGTSSLNQGGNVIKLTNDGAAEFNKVKVNFQAGNPPIMVGVSPVGIDITKPTPSSVSPPPQPTKPLIIPVDIDLSAGKPLIQPSIVLSKPSPLTPETAMSAAAERFRQEVNNPVIKPVAATVAAPKVGIDLSDAGPAKPSGGVRPSVSATGQKVEGKLGIAQTAITAGAQAAQGDVAGAAVTAGTAVAQQVGIGKVAQVAEKVAATATPVIMAAAEKLGVAGAAQTGGKFIPGLGAIIGAVETASNVTSALRQGQYAKAGIEAVTGVVATFAGSAGFGAADHIRKISNMAVTATLGDKYAPHQGSLYDTYDIAKAALTSRNDFAKLSRSDLAAAIQKDSTMVDTVRVKGVEMTLAKALEDKGFRATFLKDLEQQKKPDQIALINAYTAKLDAGQPVTPSSASVVAQVAKPASASALSPQTQAQAQAQNVTLNAQYKSMSTTQLSTAILKDPVLPDTVVIGGKTLSITEAIKDDNFRNKLISNLESAQAKGSDLSVQIAMIKAYDDKMDASANAVKPTQLAQAQIQRPVQSPPPSISAPMA